MPRRDGLEAIAGEVKIHGRTEIEALLAGRCHSPRKQIACQTPVAKSALSPT
jgi:hypothetical protein